MAKPIHTIRVDDVAKLVRASDRRVADAGSIPMCGKGFFSQSQLSVQTFTVSVHPRVQSHAFTSVFTQDYGNPRKKKGGGGKKKERKKQTPSLHRRLSSATLSQLAFHGESNPIFPWETSYWDNTVVNSQQQQQKRDLQRKLHQFSINLL